MDATSTTTRSIGWRTGAWSGALALGLITACASDTTTKAGGAAEPIRLTVGTTEIQGRPTGDQVTELADEVAELSGGAIELVPQYQVESADWDQGLIDKVESGELDLAVVPTRGWDVAGVDTFRALQAPFLVSSDALLDAVATDDALTASMLAGLDQTGVTGLALVPEGMRHVFSFGDPLATPADFEETTVRAPTSATSSALFTALGATAVGLPDSSAFQAAVLDGTVQAAESSFAFAGTLPGATTVVGNLVPYPKANVVVVNDAVFERLSDEERRALHDAAVGTRDWAVDNNLADAAYAADFCRDGGVVVLADDSGVEAFVVAAQPVYADLLSDAATATMLEQIRALAAEVEPGPAVEACAPAAVPTASITATATASEPSGTAVAVEFPEGVYRAEVTAQALLDAGVDRATTTEHAGTWTMTFADGEITIADVNAASGRRSEGHGPYCIEGDRVVLGQLGSPPACGDFWSARWVLDGDELRFLDIETAHGPDPFLAALFGLPVWLRIDDVPTTAAPSSAGPGTDSSPATT